MIHLLMSGGYDDSIPVAALTPDQATAIELAAATLTLPTGYAVQEVPGPPESVVIEEVGTYARGGATICWDGTVSRYLRASLPFDPAIDVIVERRARLILGDIVIEAASIPEALWVHRWPMDLDYKPMVTLHVEGPDPDEVRARFDEERAAILADPVAAVIDAWKAPSHVDRFGYFLGRPENARLAEIVGP